MKESISSLKRHYRFIDFFAGPDFEERIRGNEADNPKFNFLNPNDPYYAYYEHKLKEFRESDLSEPPPAALQDKETSAPSSKSAQQKVFYILFYFAYEQKKLLIALEGHIFYFKFFQFLFKKRGNFEK